MNKSFTTNVRFLLDSTNAALSQKGISSIGENPIFISSELNHSAHAEFVASSQGSVELRLVLNDYGIQVGVEEFYELYSWSIEDVKNKTEEYKSFLNYIFFSKIEIKRCALGFNYIYVFNGHERVEYGKPFDGCFPLLLFPLSYTPLGCKVSQYNAVFT